MATGRPVRRSLDAGYDLAARVPGRPRSSYFVKGDFDIDLKDLTGTCPAGQTTSDLRSGGYRRSALGGQHSQPSVRLCPLCLRGL